MMGRVESWRVAVLSHRCGETGRAVDVNILKVLKGDKKPGCFRIATIYPMESNTTYMLYNFGGKVLEMDFLAVPELSVVPLPETFKIEELKDKEPKEQMSVKYAG
jgi:hypothetical protein